jgi:FdrA protein
VPGEYAAVEAFAALRAGLHVFCFSDRVSLDDEVALKKEARSRGLLVMGPDCGTAYLDGVGLGFYNEVRPGPVGVVAASGTGLQEAACLLHGWGLGISQALGTGGRDLLAPVAGSTTLTAIEWLAADARTDVILLLAKAAEAGTATRALEALAAQPKPAVACLRGVRVEMDGVLMQPTIRSAAAACARAVGATPPLPGAVDAPPAPEGNVIGLFAGGSMLAEAEAVLREAGVGDRLGKLVDFGAEAFTRGRPHPMIDPQPRARALRDASRRPETAVLLFDVILGHGAHRDPAGVVAEALADPGRRSEVVCIASLCGTDRDPQGAGRQRALLEGAGVLVFDSAAEAAGAAALSLRRARVGA